MMYLFQETCGHFQDPHPYRRGQVRGSGHDGEGRHIVHHRFPNYPLFSVLSQNVFEYSYVAVLEF
jgi:hypothetical protein